MDKYTEIKERFEAHQDPENAVKMAKQMIFRKYGNISKKNSGGIPSTFLTGSLERSDLETAGWMRSCLHGLWTKTSG